MKAPEGLNLLPFQDEGVDWVQGKFKSDHKSLLIADEMGLGKTVQALATINLHEFNRILIICPASLKLNWEREAKKWLIKDYTIFVIMSSKDRIPPADIIICNYEMLSKHPLSKTKWDFVIADEAHYIKNKDTKRTQATLAIKSDYTLFLTGTPILNRPVELFTIANRCDPARFPNFFKYAIRYCNAQKNHFGWDTSGASNLGELQQTLKSTFMIRRKKADVLKDLPPKRRQLIELPPTAEMRTVLDREKMEWSLHEASLAKLVARRDKADILNDDEEYKFAARELKAATNIAFSSMAKLRQQTALAKLPLCIAHIKDLMDSVSKLVVFAHHIEVIRNLALELKQFNPVVIMGETAQEARQRAVDKFQTDPATRIFIGGIQAAGVGLTLTQSSTVVFCEADWTPALLSQAEDRCHRIGQRDSVLVQHLVLESSLDAIMLKKVIDKQDVIDAALDGGATPVKPATGGKKRNWAEEGKKVTPDQREAMIKALKQVAAQDKDQAREKNEKGFSAFHTDIGQSLAKLAFLTDAQAGFARHLVQRYRGQLDIGILKACGI